MKYLATLLGVLALGSSGQPQGAPLKPPNILLIVVEDLSARVGAFGDPVARTPNIDDMAADGVRFTRVFATSGVCAPSRAALITGMYQQAIGAQHMRTSSFGRERSGELGTFSTPGPPYEAVPPEYVKAFPELLRAAGYFTMNNAKTDYQFGDPFTVWDVSGNDVTLADRDPNKPFFFMLSNNTTHESGLFREGFANTLDNSAELVARNNSRLARLDVSTDPAVVSVPGFLPDTPEVRRDIARLYDNVRLMDDWVGDVVKQVQAAGLRDDTIIIWTTDHGDGLPRGKRSIYDSGLHVPFVIRFPDKAGAGTINARLVSFVDIAPTLLALAGAPIPDYMHGRDFLDDTVSPRDYVHAARDRLDELPDRSRAVRDTRFKYIRNYVSDRPQLGPLYYRENIATMAEIRRLHRNGELTPVIAAYVENARPAEELYDLATDPDEVSNVVDDPAYREALERLRAELDRWLEAVGDLGVMSEADMIGRMWPDGVQPQTVIPDIGFECGNGRATVVLRAVTPGSSLGWRIAGSEGWSLYTSPQPVDPGTAIEAKAIRYGFRESSVRSRVSAGC